MNDSDLSYRSDDINDELSLNGFDDNPEVNNLNKNNVNNSNRLKKENNKEEINRFKGEDNMIYLTSDLKKRKKIQN